MDENELQKTFEEYRRGLHHAKKQLLAFSQECDIHAEKETEPFKKQVLKNSSEMAVHMEDMYNNVESILVANHITSVKLDDLVGFIFQLKEVQNNDEFKKQIAKILSKDYTS
jgi:hypothetical protein